MLVREGRLDEADSAAGRCFTLGDAAGEIDALAFLACHTLVIRWLQGREAELADAIGPLTASLARTRTDFTLDACAALVAVRAGRPESARAALHHLAVDGLAALPQSNGWLPGMLVIVEVAAALGDGAVTGEAYDLLLPFADLPVVVSPGLVCLGSTERGLGLAALTFGELDRAVDHLERAVAANLVLDNRPFWTIAPRRLGGGAAAAWPGRRPGAAVDLLRAAIPDAEGMGMGPWASGWRVELAELEAAAHPAAPPRVVPGATV